MNNDVVSVVIVDEPFIYAEMEILGIPLREHILRSLSEYEPIIVGCKCEIKEIESKYTVIMFTHMPLITPQSIQDLVNHCEQTGVDSMKIGSGYICKSDILQEAIPLINYHCDESLSALDPHKLSEIFNILRLRKIDDVIDAGAIILDKTAMYIDVDVEVESGAIIYPMVTIQGMSKIKGGAIIRSGSVIENSTIHKGANIFASYVYDSNIGENTTVGPCTLIRAKSEIGKNVRIGDFVEIKASKLADGVKAAHLTYIGDAEVGSCSNIGCGTVFANYNGKIKQKTIVGENAFIGSNTNLIAPVKIGNNAYTAAGSTVTEDVPEGTLCIARSRQVLKERKDS